MFRKQDILLRSLEQFYQNPETHETFSRMVRGDGPVSLRLMEWFVTNYAKKFNVIYHTPELRCFNVYLSYKAQLKAYNKRHFDPFCRHERSTITDKDGNTVETTVGQANFFRWVLQNGVLSYAIENARDIESDMSAASKDKDTDTENVRSKTGRRKRRGQISQSATRHLNKTEGDIVISFS